MFVQMITGLAWVQYRQTYFIVRIPIYNSIKFCTVLNTLFHLYTILNVQCFSFEKNNFFYMKQLNEQSI